ncbi:unnamed protein product [Calypogeia fissa]
MSGWGAHVRVTVGAVAGGILGFYVMHHAEAAYKRNFHHERMREEYLKVFAEKQALDAASSGTSSGEILQDS